MRYSKDQALDEVKKDQLEASANKETRAASKELLQKYKADFYVVRSGRFRAPRGETTRIIILDRSVDDVEFVREHAFYNTGNNETSFELCYKEDGNVECPMCKAAGREYKGAKNSYMRMGFTVLHITKDKEGKQVVYKKFMTVKQNEISDFLDKMNACERKHGTIRGLGFRIKREDGEKTAASGKPVLETNDELYKLYSEKDLQAILKKYQPTQITKVNKDGKTYVVKPEGWLIAPIKDYEGIHLNTDFAVLQKKYDPDYVLEDTFESNDELDLEFDSEEDDVEISFDSNGDEVKPTTAKAKASTVKSKSKAKVEDEDSFTADVLDDELDLSEDTVLDEEDEMSGEELEELPL